MERVLAFPGPGQRASRPTGPMRRAIAALLLAALPATGVSAETRHCTVDRLSGASSLLTIDGISTRVEPGQAIPAAAELVTGRDTRIGIACDDGTTVTLGPQTTVVLDGLAGPAGADENVLIRLVNGIVGIIAPNRTWNRFEVETDVAIASVRSTEWIVEVDPAIETAVYVSEGKVDVRVSEQAFALAQGDGISIDTGLSRSTTGAVQPTVSRWSTARVSRARSALGLAWE